MKELTSHQFPEVYKRLKVNLDTLGCIMLDLKPPAGALGAKKSIEDGLYYAKDKAKFWINGWSFDAPHITLLYGLMTPGFEEPMKGAVNEVLEGWKLPEVEIESVGFFDSKVESEPYYCIIAHIKKTEKLLEGNARLRMLPHIDTFPDYKPHATIAYIRQDKGTQYRDDIIANLNQLFKGKRMPITRINHGSKK